MFTYNPVLVFCLDLWGFFSFIYLFCGYLFHVFVLCFLFVGFFSPSCARTVVLVHILA